MKVSVNMREGYANTPDFVVSNIGIYKRPTYPWYECAGIHRCDEASGLVHYFYTDGKPCQGFGGAIFEGMFYDLKPFRYQGAWSSRAGCVNQWYPEDPIVDCGIRDARGWLLSGAVTMEALINAIYAQDDLGAFGLALIRDESKEVTLIPTYVKDGKAVSKSTLHGDRKNIRNLWVPSHGDDLAEIMLEIRSCTLGASWAHKHGVRVRGK